MGGRICAALALLAVTACTVGEKPEAAPSPSKSPSPTTSWFPAPTPTPSEPFTVRPGSLSEARTLYRAAFRRLVRADSGEYQVLATSRTGDEELYREEGRYALLSGFAETTRTFRMPTDLTAHLRMTPGGQYVQIEEWPGAMAGCWMYVGSATMAAMIGATLDQGPLVPLPISIFAWSRPLGVSSQDDNVLAISAPLRDVLQMLGISQQRLAKVKVPKRMRTEVKVTLVSGQLAELTVDGVSVLLDVKGLDLLAPELAMLGDADAVASFYTVESPVRVSAPSEELVVRSEKEADRGCLANVPDA